MSSLKNIDQEEFKKRHFSGWRENKLQQNKQADN